MRRAAAEQPYRECNPGLPLCAPSQHAVSEYDLIERQFQHRGGDEAAKPGEQFQQQQRAIGVPDCQRPSFAEPIADEPAARHAIIPRQQRRKSKLPQSQKDLKARDQQAHRSKQSRQLQLRVPILQ